MSGYGIDTSFDKNNVMPNQERYYWLVSIVVLVSILFVTVWLDSAPKTITNIISGYYVCIRSRTCADAVERINRLQGVFSPQRQ